MINISAKNKREKVVDFLKGYHPSTPATYKIATSLLGGLDRSTLNELAMAVEDDFIHYRIRKMLGASGKSQRNIPVGKLLKLYQDKKSGKVTTSRDELFRRLPYLDTIWQKRTIVAFFNGSESDIEKMSRYLVRHWDDMYAMAVKTAWLGNRENAYLSTLVIRFLDLEFVMKHLEELKVYGSLALASRLCQAGVLPHVDDWPLPDYLAILYKAGRSIEEEEAIGLMISYLVSAASKDIETGRVPDYTFKSDIEHPSLIYLEGVRLLVYYLGRMGLVQALSEFKAIDDEVCGTLNRGIIQQILTEKGLSKGEKITAIWRDFCSFFVTINYDKAQGTAMVKRDIDAIPRISYGRIQRLESELDSGDIDLMDMKKVIYFDMDGVLADFESGLAKVNEGVRKKYEGRFDEIPGLFSLMEPMPGAIDAIHRIQKDGRFELYILSTAPWNNPSAWSDKLLWVQKHLDDVFHKRIIITHCKNLLKGDYLIDDRGKNGTSEFEGEWIQFGSSEFPDWEKVLTYLKVQ